MYDSAHTFPRLQDTCEIVPKVEPVEYTVYPQLSTSLSNGSSNGILPPPPPSRFHRMIDRPDIVEAIMDVCLEAKSYGTMASLALFSKHHHSIVQPRLRRLRKRIVLNLDEFAWRDEDNDQNIEIIECTRMSPMPISVHTIDPDKVKTQIEALQQHLRPTTIFYRGTLHESVLQIWKHLFPTATLLICCADEERDIESLACALPLGTKTSWLDQQANSHKVMRTFVEQHTVPATALREALPTATLRYRLRQYAPVPSDHVGHTQYLFRGITNEGRVTLEQEVTRRSSICDHKNILFECMSLVPETVPKFDTIHIDCYTRFAGANEGSLFYRPAYTLPDAYIGSFKHIEDASLKYLKDSRSRFVFRLFVVGHGEDEDEPYRSDMVPVYSATCGMQAMYPTMRAALVFQRFIDEDFASCRMNKGCKRCRSQDPGHFMETDMPIQ